jgi:hypothetical protein
LRDRAPRGGVILRDVAESIDCLVVLIGIK